MSPSDGHQGKATPRVFLYLLDHDTGYAPNPFHGWCTLAGCKPQIRRSAGIGDWVVGVTPKADGHRVAYVMQVKVKFEIAKYHRDHRFRRKRRPPRPRSIIEACGDNLVRPRDPDPNAAFVLAAKRFAYYGSKPRDWPRALRRIQMPSRYYLVNHDPETLHALLRFVRACRTGVHAPPRSWAEGDRLWRKASRRSPCG